MGVPGQSESRLALHFHSEGQFDGDVNGESGGGVCGLLKRVWGRGFQTGSARAKLHRNLPEGPVKADCQTENTDCGAPLRPRAARICGVNIPGVAAAGWGSRLGTH